MRVVVLAGSGLSMDAGYPSTAMLTQKVLSGEGVYRHTDGTYYLSAGGAAETSPDVGSVVKFADRLRELAVGYYVNIPNRHVNYEDLAYVAGQLGESRSGEYDNPALGPLDDVLRPDIERILERRAREYDEDADEDPDGEDTWSADDLPRETLNYISDVAWRSLEAEHGADYLGEIVAFVRDDRLRDVSIFTLNHDTLLERALRAAGLEFTDGFGAPVITVAAGTRAEIRYWEPDRLRQDSPSRRLVKLHGSVDWFLLRPDGGEFHEERIAQVSGDYWHTGDATGQLQLPSGGRPLLLVGTHNKARGYLNPPFFDAHIAFYERLKATGVLLVIGYGGQDKAVNERIVDWMESSLSNRLVIVNPSTAILEDVRGSLRGHERIPTMLGDVPAKGIPRWREQGRFELINLPVRDVSAERYFEAVSRTSTSPA